MALAFTMWIINKGADFARERDGTRSPTL
jgi:hypothetical protein